jgi:hypothetical protein
MRATITTLAGLVALARAAPLPPTRSAMAHLNATPPIELAREGCGPGWHRHHWRDRWGYWHWGHCVPNW